MKWFIVALWTALIPLGVPAARTLPTVSQRPLDAAPALYVDAAKGDDSNIGTFEKPWKSITFAITKLRPGDTLVLRGGIYYESLTLSLVGEPSKPITIRSYPKELAIVDGGCREFLDDPAKAWQPIEGGDGEYRSTKSYPKLGEIVLGHFADSMIPLHGYRNAIDLRSKNAYWSVTNKLNADENFYCGPGLWYDPKTGYLHSRFAPTDVDVLGENNYRGETDPRKLKLIVAGARPPLTIEKSKHLRIQDVVIRGGSRATVAINDSASLELDTVAIFGGSPALQVIGVHNLKVTHSLIRGISAPWSSRAGQKYRGNSAYLIVSRVDGAVNKDIEIAHSELTDSHDGLYIGTIRGLKLHHNLIENFNDDGIYLTAGNTGGDIHIYQNHISKCLHSFAYAGKYPAGAGVSIYRNVFDMRQPVAYQWPKAARDPEFWPEGAKEPRWPLIARIAGDHGSPTWEPMRFYHNTIVARDPAFRDFYLGGWGGHVNEKRELFNNIYVQMDGNPGLEFGTVDDRLLTCDGNLLWNPKLGPMVKGDFFAKFRQSARFMTSQKHYTPGWTAHDRYADPQLKQLSDDYRVRLDVRLREGSPAINAGVPIPAEWPDPLRELDKGKPDIGALPFGIDG